MSASPSPPVEARTLADVVIVGAGPVGLMLAICLAEQGISIRILDTLEKPIIQWKACVLHSRTQEMLTRHHLFRNFGDAAAATSGMNFVADGRIYRLNLGAANTARPGMLLISQDATENILREVLETRFDIRVERGWSLEHFSSDVQIDRIHDPNGNVTIHSNWTHADGSSLTLSSAFLVGCDGAHSRTRKAMDLPFHGSALETLMAVADVTLDSDLPQPQEPHTFTHPHGMVGFFPLPAHRSARVIMALPLPDKNGISTEDPAYAVFVTSDLSQSPEPALETSPLLGRPVGTGMISKNNFARELQARMHPWKLTSCELQDVRPFRVNERRAKVFHDPRARVFLCGDAAHVHSPAGGQGLNIGFQDAENLGWKLAAVIKRHSPPSILPTYGVERAPIADHAIGLSGKLLRILSFRGWVTRLLRRVFFRAIVSFSSFNALVAGKISQIATIYPPGTLGPVPRLPRKPPASWPRPGQRAPEARVWAMPGNRQTYLLSEIPAQWHILSFIPARGSWPSHLAALRKTTSAYRLSLLHIIIAPTDLSRDPETRDARVLLDLKDDQARLAWGIYHIDEGVAFLIRPDGIIAAAAPLSHAHNHFPAFLDTVLVRRE